METRLQTGTLWSGIGHAGAVVWLLLGDWLFTPDAPMEMQSTQVSMISSAEFDAMVSSAPKASDTPTEQPSEAAATEPVQPDTPAIEESPAPPERPEAVPLPEPEPAPEAVPEPLPPEPEVQPEPVPQPNDLATAPEDQPLPSMSSSVRPKPKPADRVAPVPVSVPEEAVTSEAPEEAVSEEPAEEPQPPQEAREETVAEESGDVLRTEATEEQEEALGMTASVRPKSRPSRPTPSATPVETPAASASAPAEAEDNSDADAIAAAVAAAAAESAVEEPAQSATAGQGGIGNSSGPPLNAGEIGDVSSAIGKMWNVGSLSTEAMQTVVVVRVAFQPDGQPTSCDLVESTGPAGGVSVAKAAACRAIARTHSQGGGIPFPPEKYETWKVVEFVFDANGMRMR